MRQYGKRQSVVLIFGAALSVAAAMFAVLDEVGVALAGISLLMGLGLFVTLDIRQRLRDLARGNEQSRRAAANTNARLANVTDRLSGLNSRVTALTGRLDAGDTRLLASIEAVRTDANDRRAEAMANLDQLSDEQTAHSSGHSNS